MDSNCIQTGSLAPADVKPDADAKQQRAGNTPPGQETSVWVAYMLAAFSALLFSTKGIAVKLAYAQKVDVETLLALRMGFAVPFYLLIGGFAIRDISRRGGYLPAAGGFVRTGLIGILGYWFASYTDFLGLSFISAQFERLILFTYPIFVVIFGMAFFGQKITAGMIAGALTSYAGLALIFTQAQAASGRALILGTFWVLCSALAYAYYQLVARIEIKRIGPRLFTCIAMTGASLGSFAQFFITHGITLPSAGGTVLLLGLYLAIGATVLPTFLMNAALHRISAQMNASIGNLSPIATIVLAVLILGEPLTVIDVTGAGLVVAGISWFTLHRSENTSNSASDPIIENASA